MTDYIPEGARDRANSAQLPVQVRITRGNRDYKIGKIPAGVMGQTYVVLSRSCTDFTDENIIAGPALFEVSPAYLPLLNPRS